MTERHVYVIITFIVAVAVVVMSMIVAETTTRNRRVESEGVRACVEASDGSPLAVWFCGGRPKQPEGTR